MSDPVVRNCSMAETLNPEVNTTRASLSGTYAVRNYDLKLDENGHNLEKKNLNNQNKCFPDIPPCFLNI